MSASLNDTSLTEEDCWRKRFSSMSISAGRAEYIRGLKVSVDELSRGKHDIIEAHKGHLTVACLTRDLDCVQENNLGFTIENDILKGEEVVYQNAYNSLGKFVLDRLEANPDLVGQIDAVTDETYTYKMMRERSVRCALWMKSQGLVPGDVVVICSQNRLDVTIACFAALYLGAVVRPLDPTLFRTEGSNLLRVGEPKIAFVSEESATTLVDAVRDTELDVKIVVFGQVASLIEFESAITQSKAKAVETFRCTSIENPKATAFILCTSGTTGRPKGVALSHHALLRQMHQSEGLGMVGHICVVFASLSWITGTFYVFMCLFLNIPILIMPPFDEYSASALIEKHKVSWILVNPSILNRLLNSGVLDRYRFPCLKHVLCAGAPLPYTPRQAFTKSVPTARIITGYGSTEMGCFMAIQTMASEHGSCGRLMANCQLKVVDPNTGQIMGVNQEGELLQKSTMMMTSYYDNPQTSAQAVDEEGWMHMGDLGYYNEDGEIFIIERLKELIKYRDYHISPSVIENLILSYPGVIDVAVLGVSHPQDNEHPIAFVVTSTNSRASDKQILKKLRTAVKNESNLKNLTNRINTLKSRSVEQRSMLDDDESSRHSDTASERLCNLRYQKMKLKVLALTTRFKEMKGKVNEALDTMAQKLAASMTENKLSRKLFCEEENIVDLSLDHDDLSLQTDLIRQTREIEDKISKLPRFANIVTTIGSEKVTRTHLGSGISIDADVWELIQVKSEHPKFVKDLATAIWGRNVIINRSLDGRAAGRLPNQEKIRKALTPLKLNPLRKCFEHRLKEKNYKGEQLARELETMNSYLTELLNDYIKRELKELKKSHLEVEEKGNNTKKEIDVTIETMKSDEEDNLLTNNNKK